MLILRNKLFIDNVASPITSSNITKSAKPNNIKSVTPKPNKAPKGTTLQIAKMRQQNELTRLRKHSQNLQLEQAKLRARGQENTERKLRSIKDNQIKVKKLEQSAYPKTDISLYRPKLTNPLIVSIN